VKGQTYALDFFFAERHTVESNFRLETTLKFTNCAPIIK
jgi:fibro-slime domain-containing protein